MLTVKEINEVSFGKAGFSGYKPEDVDNFIDEVASSFAQLLKERDEAAAQNQELTARVAELTAKNAETQEKLSLLAQKIESYREDEDEIKSAILSAQKVARNSVAEAQTKADGIVAEAEREARDILDNAKQDAKRAAKEYAAQTDAKREELEEMKRQVTAFRASLLEMYKKHLESINHIPNFRVKERDAEPVPAVRPAEEAEPEEPAPAPAPVSAPAQVSPAPAPEPVKEAQPAPEEKAPVQAAPAQAAPAQQPGLHDRVRYTEQQPAAPQEPTKEFSLSDYPEGDLSEVGIDLKTYSNIPESLRREKNSNFSNLEFGDDVDLGTRRKK